MIASTVAGYNTGAASARRHFDGPRTGLKRPVFRVFHEIFSRTQLRWNCDSLPVPAMPSAKLASGDRTNKPSNSPNRAEPSKPPPIGHFVGFLRRADIRNSSPRVDRFLFSHSHLSTDEQRHPLSLERC